MRNPMPMPMPKNEHDDMIFEKMSDMELSSEVVLQQLLDSSGTITTFQPVVFEFLRFSS